MHELQRFIEHIPPAVLVIVRLSGLMIFGPIFGSSVIPVKIKIFLAIFIGVSVYPLLNVVHQDVPMSLDLFMLGPLMAMELLIGLIIGYAASVPLIAVQTGGLMMGQQMGLGFARFFNPTIDDEADIVGQMLFFMALSGFLVIGGHEAMVLAVLHSFDHVPLGGFAADVGLLDLIAGMLTSAFELALRIAAPLLAIIIMQSLAMGFIAKTVPQINILSLGFPMRIILGLGIVAFGLLVMHEVIMDAIDDTWNVIFSWIQSLGNGEASAGIESFR